MGGARDRETVATGLTVGNPAVLGPALRPVALRPCLSTGVPFSNEFKSSHSVDCAVNFPRDWFPDIVKSNQELSNCDHKSRRLRRMQAPLSIDFRFEDRLSA